MTKRLHVPVIAALTLCAVVAGIVAARVNRDGHAEAAPGPMRLAKATMIVEVNATDGDAGLQVFLDGEAWRSMAITGPDGGTILDINAVGRLEDFGLTELFSESSEPPFDVFPLEEFKALWPEGRYSFAGTTVDGRRLTGRATLSHDIPSGPEITSPTEGATVAPGNVVASWDPGSQPSGVDIVGYRVIVERDNPLRVFSVELPASDNSVTIPSEYFDPGTEYKLEVLAIEASGNQTLTEITFDVT
jgi:hypothetical protein